MRMKIKKKAVCYNPAIGYEGINGGESLLCPTIQDSYKILSSLVVQVQNVVGPLELLGKAVRRRVARASGL
jgi:hypothetical protein